MLKALHSDSWGVACICALLKASASSSPVEFLFSSLFSGDHQPKLGWRVDRSHKTSKPKISIDGYELSDEGFKSQQHTLLERTQLVLLDDCLRCSKLSAGFIWTAILHRITNQVEEHEHSELFLRLSKGLQYGLENRTRIEAARGPAIRNHPLPKDGASIRVLVLLPATSFNHPVHCELAYGSLRDLAYDALSYVWGDPSVTREITVDKQPMQVTYNLFDALKHLRNESEPKVLWIDAICINQSDVEERGFQVQLMGDIYSSAHRVRIWLGLESESTPQAWNCVYGETSLPPEASMIYRTDYQKKMQKQIRVQGVRHSIQGDPRPVERDALVSLATRPWFSRNWVVQEAVLAKAVFVQCGGQTMGLELLEKCFFEFHRNISNDIDQIAKSIRSLAFFNILDPTQSITTLDLVDTARSMQCFDPRDKVYSILHMDAQLSQHNLLVVTPSYSISTEELYVQSAKSIITRSKSMDILSRAQTLQPKRIRMLPSWAPDWREESWQTVAWDRQSASDIVPAFLLLKGRRFEAFNAGGAQILADEPQFSLNDRLIETKVVVFDTIAVEGTTFGPSGWEGLAHTVEQCFSTFEVYLGKPRSTFAEQFWRAIVMGYQLPDPETLLQTQKWSKWNTFQIKLKELQNEVPGLFKIPPRTHDEQKMLIEHIAKCMFYPAFHGTLRLYVTTGGTIVLGPKQAQKGDTIAIFPNTRMPYVLRKDMDFYTVLGPCYACGIMFGELFEEPLASKFTLEDILLA